MVLWDNERKEISRQVFGRPARVLLAAWILEREGEAFFQTEAKLALANMGEAQSAATQELERFVEWGLITRSDPPPGERRVWYAQNKDSDLWAIFEGTCEALDLLP